MKHFNGLTPAEAERLAILIEECAEVVQAGCKILRHGFDSFNPTIPVSETNRRALARELGDVMYAAKMMTDAMDISEETLNRRALSKPERIKPYLHHQGQK